MPGRIVREKLDPLPAGLLHGGGVALAHGDNELPAQAVVLEESRRIVPDREDRKQQTERVHLRKLIQPGNLT